MKYLYLTYGLNANDERIDTKLEHSSRVNAGDILSKYITNDNFSSLKLTDILNEYLSGIDNDILIGFSLSSRTDYYAIKQKLDLIQDYQLTKVYLVESNTYPEYKKQYDIVSSRWLDYHPDYVKEQDRLVNEELQELAKVLVADGIEVEFIK